MSNITTLVLSSLRNNTCKAALIKYNPDIHPIIFLINLQLELKRINMNYLPFDELVSVLYCDDINDFWHVIAKGGRNLVTLPLGYDGTSHTLMFVNTMMPTGNINIIDLRDCKMPEFTCYTKNGKACIRVDEIDLIDDKTDADILTSYHRSLFEKYKQERETAIKSENRNDYSKVQLSIRKEYYEKLDVVKEIPDGVEFTINEDKFIKGIPVTERMLVDTFWFPE